MEGRGGGGGEGRVCYSSLFHDFVFFCFFLLAVVVELDLREEGLRDDDDVVEDDLRGEYGLRVEVVGLLEEERGLRVEAVDLREEERALRGVADLREEERDLDEERGLRVEVADLRREEERDLEEERGLRVEDVVLREEEDFVGDEAVRLLGDDDAVRVKYKIYSSSSTHPNPLIISHSH